MLFDDLIQEYRRKHDPTFNARSIPRRFWYGPGDSRRILILLPKQEREHRRDVFPLNYILENLPAITFCATHRYPPADFWYHGSVLFGSCEHKPKGPKLKLPDIYELENEVIYTLSLCVTKIELFLRTLGEEKFCGLPKKELHNP